MAPNHRACWCIGIGLLLPTASPAPAAPLEEVAWLETLPEATLKRMYLRCDREASRRLLSLDEAHHCSAAADILKARSFGGDFDALLAWWRQHRDLGEAREPVRHPEPVPQPGDRLP